MRIRHESESEAPPNLMPLIDMVFLLLIFFLVATTFSQEERDLDVQLPSTATAQPLSAPPQQLIINILQDGTMKVSGRTLNLQQLSDMLHRVARDEPNRTVLIRADERSLHRYFARAANLCRQSGINPLNIGYLADHQGGGAGAPGQ